MTDLKQYIAINRWYMTTKEMAQELGVPVIKVSGILSYNKWTAISEADRVREYIRDNPGTPVEDIAKKFNRTIYQVNALAAEVGIKLKRRPVEPEPENKCPVPREKLMDWARQEGYGVVMPPRQDRLKEAYTQSGSPYGFADELRKIKTK